MKAELIFTGTELLLGHILNTHAQYLGAKLSGMGIEVDLNTTVGDNRETMIDVLRQALDRSSLIIITGGLGPTTDDITVEVVAEVFGLPLILDQVSLKAIKRIFQSRSAIMPESNVKQAYFPRGAIILPNNVGTAPGAILEIGNKIVMMLPGPPHELTYMFEDAVTPYLAGKTGGSEVIRYRVFKLTGISESAVQDLLKDLGGQGNPGIAYMAKPGEIQVRISARGADSGQADALLADFAGKVRSRVEKYIFACDEAVLEELVGKLLLERGLSIGVAESCTGGLIAARLTDIPGSSAYFKGGVVSYSNEMKNRVLGVDIKILDSFGAVSRETAEAMAAGVRAGTGADLGLAVTGIAGPAGGTAAKPRGLVYVALAAGDITICRGHHFPGIRMAVRQGTVNASLNMVRQYLLDKA
ncbi:competence/damage-inducible protein A [Pelotomaculum propionicicum]|uniref:competence/damage-inducible protein A n=1 Tax=Pelotomaculum propionicicum TaxID=258475 RepID=UPI003B7C97EC